MFLLPLRGVDLFKRLRSTFKATARHVQDWLSAKLATQRLQAGRLMYQLWSSDSTTTSSHIFPFHHRALSSKRSRRRIKLNAWWRMSHLEAKQSKGFGSFGFSCTLARPDQGGLKMPVGRIIKKDYQTEMALQRDATFCGSAFKLLKPSWSSKWELASCPPSLVYKLHVAAFFCHHRRNILTYIL